MSLYSKLFLHLPSNICGITEQVCVWVSDEKEPDCDVCYISVGE